MARRRKRKMSPAAKAASRRNLEKARAARSKSGFTQSATSAAKKEATHRVSVTKIMTGTKVKGAIARPRSSNVGGGMAWR